ncbi:Dehydrogenase/reductase SDR family member 4 [Hondaea fermentalgiana]|uniref:Dehydrogenase/reductase SDR family member 4 n=1 Tax=Hondaea fermentalgiana TaxID=2315210 RepID=A0A2R5GVX6_9STRA|nr:Dehydrogenase/reductase SDR family member 4 [Hondaea fermentalgiana]|eukprot:GBG32074.1 Dehydrogenase/reductase SDR family member 4 [Hondaea fermentalgiana]
MSLRGRLALVTGASSGIGAAAALKLASHGCAVALTGRKEEALLGVMERIKNDLGNEAPQVAIFPGDATQEADVDRIVQESVKLLGENRLDILVNCAGVLKGGAVGAADMANWDANFDTNARGVFCFMSKAIPYMEKPKGELTSSIVNVSSVNGLQSFGGVAAYCASKAAVDMLTDCAAVDLAPKGIRCNTVNPGVIVTELQKRGGLSDEQYAGFLKRSEEVTHPLGRVGKPDEAAEAILFLADSSKSDFITGTHLTIDGGRRCLGAR